MDLQFKKAPKKVAGLDALTKQETVKQLKNNTKLPYKREMKGLYSEGKITSDRLYWVYDSTAPVYITKSGDLVTFRQAKNAPINKAFYIGVNKKESGYHTYKRNAKVGNSKPTPIVNPKVNQPKSYLLSDLEIVNKKLDLIIEMLSVVGVKSDSKPLTITKGDITINL